MEEYIHDLNHHDREKLRMRNPRFYERHLVVRTVPVRWDEEYYRRMVERGDIGEGLSVADFS